MKYRAYYTTVASSYVEFEAEEGDDLLAAADDAANEQGLPNVCARCSGWGQKQGIELAEWEPADEKFGPNIEAVGP